MKAKYMKKQPRKIPGADVFDFLTKKDKEKFSVVLMKVYGKKNKTKDTHSDKVYYIIKGKGTMIIGRKIICLEKGMVVYIKRNEIYTASGHFDAIVVNTPPFDPNYEIVYKDNDKL